MKTNIFGTFGPACGKKDILVKMIQAGLTGMRLNLSHTTLADSLDYVQAYSSACEKSGIKPQLLIDMQGPELRIGNLKSVVSLQKGERVVFGKKDASPIDKVFLEIKNSMWVIPVPGELIQEAEQGDEILLDDGKILVQVKRVLDYTENTSSGEVSERFLEVEVLRGGDLHSYKSIKLCGKNIKMPALTKHDIKNIKRAKAYGVTAIMQPFVLSGDELRYVRSVLKEYDAEDIPIYAKIENRLGVENLEDILPEADVIVIARGDLGNDIPLWELPRVQKHIENACKKAGKPYIVVTQMLASMETKPVPTRAEVSDIFHAVYHGAGGVMVTGETAIGMYPVEVIKYLANTVKEAEEEEISNG